MPNAAAFLIAGSLKADEDTATVMAAAILRFFSASCSIQRTSSMPVRSRHSIVDQDRTSPHPVTDGSVDLAKLPRHIVYDVIR